MARGVVLEELFFRDMLGDGDLKEVNPVKHDRRDNRKSHEYSFGGIESELFSEINNPNVNTRVTKDGIWWHYSGKAPVFITEDGQCYTRRSDSRKEAEKQAYFALNHMDSQGIVYNWSRK